MPTKAKIIISAEGEIGFFTQSGSYGDGVKVIADLLAQLKAAGLDLDEGTGPEQHRHDEIHLHTHVEGTVNG